jgi:asparagine synthase (glutamine-hydrolysing)
MGVQFGLWNLDGKQVDPALVARAHLLLRPYSDDRMRVVYNGVLAGILDGDRAGRPPGDGSETRPNPFCVYWEGRLDNREEVARVAGISPTSLTDAGVIQQAFASTGTDLFRSIVGDWALSVVRRAERELILATDFIGTKRLFYRVHDAAVAWSTILEPLVLLDGHLPPFSEEYLAGWLSFFPESGITPYRGILSVPPASFVRISPGKISVQKYWHLESSKPIRYRTEREYEEHFRSTFREAVRRRVDATGPVLAELSGGMDSSSIVCVADALLRDNSSAQSVDTVTYFDSAEPAWDELPFAGRVEERRGRAGCHIDIGPEQGAAIRRQPWRFHALPTSSYSRSLAAEVFDRLVSKNGYRAVLSGLGGDEMLGGVPTPLPELADLIARLRVCELARQSFRWALAKKKHMLGLWRGTLGAFLPPHGSNQEQNSQSWKWLTPEFRARNAEHLGFQPQRFHFFGPLPSLQANAEALQVLSRQICCVPFSPTLLYEWRYPFLDRDLVTFCSSIPREQLVRPTQRRSLMRRALAGAVPQEILERKRKAHVSRGLVKMLAAHWQEVRQAALCTEELGMVDLASLAAFVEQAEHGKEVPVLPLLRTVALEQWLRDLAEPGQAPVRHSLLDTPDLAHSQGRV